MATRWLPALAGAVLLGAGAGAGAELNCNAGIDLYGDGGLRRCNLNGFHRLRTRAELWVTCADAHDLEQYRDGRLKSCVVATAHEFPGLTCAAGSRVEIGPEGRVRACRPAG